MTDQRTRAYFKLLKKNQRLFRALLEDGISDKTRENVAMCLTEIYFSSRRLIGLIKRISETGPDITERELDSLLGYLCCLRSEVYDGMVRWAKTLRSPVNISIDRIADIGYEAPDAAVAEKTIQNAKKQIDFIMKKIKAYPKRDDPKRKSRRSRNKECRRN